MDANGFAALVRKGEGQLRLDELVLNTGTEEFKGRGMLRISRDRMLFEMHLPDGGILPEARAGIFTVKDCWQLTGLMDEELRFRCPHVFPTHSWHMTNATHRFVFDISHVQLIPSGWDALTTDERADQRAEVLRKADPSNDSVQSQLAELEKRKRPAPVTGSFDAILVDYPLLIANETSHTTTKHPYLGETYKAPGDTFMGEVEGMEYALVRQEGSNDLSVHARTKSGLVSESEEADQRKFNALLNAIAFVHGIHAWPYRTEYWRGGKKVMDRVRPVSELPRTHHVPFPERILHQQATSGAMVNLREPVRLMTAFIEQDTKLSREVGELLARFREADDVKHREITVVALCTLLENLVNLIFKERNLEAWAKGQFSAARHFDEAKQETSKFIEQRIPSEGGGFERVRELLRCAQALHTREKFEAVVKHLGLKWEGDFERYFKGWKVVRNDMVHEAERTGLTDEENKQIWRDESLVAGFINALILRLIGYSGPMRFSWIDDSFRRL